LVLETREMAPMWRAGQAKNTGGRWAAEVALAPAKPSLWHFRSIA